MESLKETTRRRGNETGTVWFVALMIISAVCVAGVAGIKYFQNKSPAEKIKLNLEALVKKDAIYFDSEKTIGASTDYDVYTTIKTAEGEYALAQIVEATIEDDKFKGLSTLEMPNGELVAGNYNSFIEDITLKDGKKTSAEIIDKVVGIFRLKDGKFIPIKIVNGSVVERRIAAGTFSGRTFDSGFQIAAFVENRKITSGYLLATSSYISTFSRTAAYLAITEANLKYNPLSYLNNVLAAESDGEEETSVGGNVTVANLDDPRKAISFEGQILVPNQGSGTYQVLGKEDAINLGTIQELVASTVTTITPSAELVPTIISTGVLPITSSEIEDLTITKEDIALGTIDGSRIADYSIKKDDIADDSISTAKIQGSAVTSDHIKSDTITADDIYSTLTFSSGDFINLSYITHSTTSIQGLRLPNASSATPSSPTSGEGYLAYDTSGNKVIVYDGSSWNEISGVTLTTSGETTTTSSNSGLEIDGSNALSLLRGCASGELLKWNDSTDLWECGTDTGGAGGGISTIQENNSTVVSSATVIDFFGTDFAITADGVGEGDIAIDYTNSKIVRSDQSETVTGGWTFSNLTLSDTNIPFSGGDTTFDLTGAAARTLAILNSTISQVANLNLSDGDLQTGATTRLTNAGALQNITGLTVSSGSVSLPSGQIDNAELANSSLTVTASTGLSGGGSVSLGGSVALSATLGTSIDTTEIDVDTITLSDIANLLTLDANLTVISSDLTNDYKVIFDNSSIGDVATLIQMTTSGVGATIGTGIDLSDTDIATALALGLNDITVGGVTITSSEFALIDSGIALSELTDSGTLTAGTVDINGGAIDGTTVGAISPSTGAFTTLTATGDVTMNDSGADNILIGQNGGTPDVVTIAGNVSLTDSNWSISAAGAGSLASLNLNSGGITNAGSIAGATTISGSGAVSLSSGGTSDLTLDSASGRAVVATGDFLKTSVAGVTGAAAGDIWYDSTAGKYKINEAGATKTLCNTSDLGCGSGGGGIATVEENNVDTVTTAVSLDFLGADFAVTLDTGEAVNEADVAIDYTNSGITRKAQAETITGGWTFGTGSTIFNSLSTFNTDLDLVFAGTENLTVTSDLAGTLNVLSVVGTPSGTIGTAQGIFVQQANHLTNTNGIDAALVIDNADADLAVTDGILITNTGGGGYTNILNTPSIDISGAGAITGATGVSSTTGTFSGALAANGGVTFDSAADTLGAFTAAGTINMNTNILENIGNSGTDFIASTGALTLAGTLTLSNNTLSCTACIDVTDIDADAVGDSELVNALTYTGALTLTPGTTTDFVFNGDQDSNAQFTNVLTSDATSVNSLDFSTVINAAAGAATVYGLNLAQLDNTTNTGVMDAIARLQNANVAETTANGLLIEQTGAGILTNAISIAETAGTITTGINIGTGVGTAIALQGGETIDSTNANQINLNLGTSGSLVLTSGTASTISNSAGSLTIDSTGGTVIFPDATLQLTGGTTVTVDVNTAATSTLSIVNNNGANVADLSVENNITALGGNFTGAASDSIQVGAVDNTIGFTLGGAAEYSFNTSNFSAGANLIVNIGDNNTDFTTGGGLTLAGAFIANGTSTFNTDVDGIFAGTENLAITSDLAGTLNVLSIVGTPSGTIGTAQGIFVQQANHLTNTNGIDAALVIDNADADLAVADAILITNTGGGGYTNILNTPTVDISGTGAISGATTITASTSVTSPSHTGTGAVSLSSGGSADLTLDSASGRVVVSTGDFLKTSVAGVTGAAAGDIWYDSTAGKYKINEAGATKVLCNTTDLGCGTGGGGGIATVEENNVDTVTTAVSLDFLGADFAVSLDIGEGVNEADVAIDYTNSGITRKAQAETISGGWTFNTAATTFTTGINANGGLTTTTTDTNLAFSANGAGDFVFSVDAGTLMSLTGGADGTDAINVVAGNLTLANGDLVLSGGDLNVTLDAADTLNVSKTAADAGDVANISGTSVNAIQGLTIALTSTADAAAVDAYQGLNITWTESTDADTITALNIGNTTTTNSATTAISIGTGWDTGLSVASGGMSITAGGLSNTGGTFTTSGGIASINASSNFATNINTGTSTGVVTIGNGSADVALSDANWSITGPGVATFTNIGVNITPQDALHIAVSDINSNVLNSIRMQRTDSDTVGATGLGTALDFYLEDSTSVLQQAGRLDVVWESAADTTEDSYFLFNDVIDSVLTGSAIISHRNVSVNQGGATMFNAYNRGSGDKYWNTESAFEIWHDTANDRLSFQGAASGAGGGAVTFAELLNISTTGNAILTGTLAVNGDSITSDGALTIDSNARVSIATGDFLKTSVAGVTGAAAGDIWYDSTAGKYKINEAGATKTLCNTSDLGCGSGGGGIATVEENNVDTVTTAVSLDFLGADFVVTLDTGEAVNEADVAIDYTNSGITRKAQAETISGGWTFNTAATTFTTGINANGGITTSTTDTPLAFTVNGAGDYTFAGDSDSNFQINATPTTDATLNSAVITLNPTGTGSTGALRGLVLSQSDNVNTGVYDDLFKIENLKTPETTTNGILIENNATGGTLSNALHITNTAGTLASAIVIDGIAPGSFIIDTASIDISGAGAITGATGVSSTTGTFSGALAANGGITFDQTSDTIGSFTAGGTILMNSNILQDIGNTGTDFIASTGALTLAGDLTLSNNTLVCTACIDVTDMGADSVDDSELVNALTYTGALTLTPGTTTDFVFNGDQDSNAQFTNVLTSDATSVNSLDFSTVINAAAGAATVYGLNLAQLDNTTNTGVVDAIARLQNANAAETTANGLLIEQTGAGTLTNAIHVLGTAGAITDAVTIEDGAGTIADGIQFTGTFTNLINSTNFSVTNAGALTAVGVNSGSGLLQGTGGLTLTGAVSINASGSNATNIGTGTNAGTITIGNASTGDLALNDANWSITGAGLITTSSNVAVNGGTVSSTGNLTLDPTSIVIVGAADTFQTDDVTSAGALSLTSSGVNAITLDSGTTGNVNIGNNANAKSITIGNTTTTTTLNLTKGASGNIVLTGFNCTTFTSGGALTTDASGNVTCSNDDTTGGGATVQSVYDADTDGGNVILLMTAADGSVVFQNIAGTQFQVTMAATTAPTLDLMSILNTGASQGSVTSGADGLQIDYAIGAAAGAISNAGLRINITSAAALAGSTLQGLNVDNLTSANANVTESAVKIGTGWDNEIEFADTTPVIRLADASTVSFQEAGAGTEIAALREYFSASNYGVFEANGFINIDGSYFQDNFSRPYSGSTNSQVSADVTGTSRFGDYSEWAFDEANTGGATGTVTTSNGCIVEQNAPAGVLTGGTNYGALAVSVETGTQTNASNRGACHFTMGMSTGTHTAGILNVAKKYIQYYKAKPSANWTQTPTYRYVYLGADNYPTAWAENAPMTNTNSGGIWFSNLAGTNTNNAGGTVWAGVARRVTTILTVSCGQNVLTGTAQFALMRIEARATNDIRFFIDNDVSNGISLAECGSGINTNLVATASNAIMTWNMGPAMDFGNSTGAGNGATNQTTWYVDLYAHVQDDPRDGGGQVASAADSSGLSGEVQTAVVPYDPISGADVAEYYNFPQEQRPNVGDVVVLGTSPGEASLADRPNDRRLLGVISESPSLVLGASSENTSPVAISGRVKTRVNNSGGPIKIGDPITSSNTPGAGMKASQPGKIIGTAMEGFDPVDGEPTEGKIMVNINIGYYLGDEVDTALIEQPPEAIFGDSQLANANIATGSGEASASSSASLAEVIIEKLVSFRNGIRVDKFFESIGNAIFRGPAEFLSKVIFRGRVQFASKVEFDKDTAGYATIRKGSRFVDVTFENEYDTEPIVNASLVINRLTEEDYRKRIADGVCSEADGIQTCQDKVVNEILGTDLKYAITGKSTQGFIILLNSEAQSDMTFSWTAFTVKDVRTSQSSVLGKTLETTPSPTSSPSPEPIPEPSLSPAPTESPSPSPTASPLSQTLTVLPNDLGYVRVREGPSTDTAELGQISSGETVSYTEASDGWYKIEYNGITGWVSGDYVQIN